MSSQNKYTRLLSNTVLFGISTFSSKVLSFVMTRLYTTYLTEADFGLVDLVVNSSNLLIPLVSLGISNAVIRFGLEKGTSKKGVFMGGLTAIGMGFFVLSLCLPLVAKVSVLSGYVHWMYIYVLISCLRTLCCQFVRAKLFTRLYAVDGLLSTAFTVGFNILFLVTLKMGPVGYLLSVICADALSVIFLTFAARLWRYFDFRAFDGTLYKRMLRYSLPLVPALMFWWVTNASDRYFVTYMCGEAMNGLYAAAYKIPTIVTIISTIFTEAWQLSAFTDGQGKGRERFFSQVYSAVMGISFAVGSGLILFSKFIMRFLVEESFYEAWQYVPVLILATVFATLVTFTNSVYMLEKRPMRSLLTMMVGALSNIGLNALFIPEYGPNGAAFATFLSYLLVFIIRAFNTRDLLRIRFAPLRLFANTFLLMLEAAVMINQVALWQLWCSLILVAILVLNLRSLLRGAQQLVGGRRKKAETTKGNESFDEG